MFLWSDLYFRFKFYRQAMKVCVRGNVKITLSKIMSKPDCAHFILPVCQFFYGFIIWEVVMVRLGLRGDEPLNDSHFQEEWVCFVCCQWRCYRLWPLFWPCSVFTHISMVCHVTIVTDIPGQPRPTMGFLMSHCSVQSHTHKLSYFLFFRCCIVVPLNHTMLLWSDLANSGKVQSSISHFPSRPFYICDLLEKLCSVTSALSSISSFKCSTSFCRHCSCATVFSYKDSVGFAKSWCIVLEASISCSQCQPF